MTLYFALWGQWPIHIIFPNEPWESSLFTFCLVFDQCIDCSVHCFAFVCFLFYCCCCCCCCCCVLLSWGFFLPCLFDLIVSYCMFILHGYYSAFFIYFFLLFPWKFFMQKAVVLFADLFKTGVGMIAIFSCSFIILILLLQDLRADWEHRTRGQRGILIRYVSLVAEWKQKAWWIW